jgi:hypothetical protein
VIYLDTQVAAWLYGSGASSLTPKAARLLPRIPPSRPTIRIQSGTETQYARGSKPARQERHSRRQSDPKKSTAESLCPLSGTKPRPVGGEPSRRLRLCRMLDCPKPRPVPGAYLGPHKRAPAREDSPATRQSARGSGPSPILSSPGEGQGESTHRIEPDVLVTTRHTALPHRTVPEPTLPAGAG